MPDRRLSLSIPALAVTVVTVAALAPAAGAKTPVKAPVVVKAPTTLPGLPPGAGLGYPAAPSAGVVPGPGTVGPASRVPSRVSAPGLVGSTAVVNGHTLQVAIACPADGSASISDPVIRKGTLARTRYTCTKSAAKVSFSLSKALAARIRTSGTTTGTITLGAGAAKATYSIAVAGSTAPAQFWGRDGGLQCDLYGTDRGLLVAPNFTVTPDATIDVRPWVAFYTAAHGWQWLGTGGLSRSSWYQWTASPTGVLQWMTPAGALNRWTWAPITVPSGTHIWAIGGFEVVYLYAHAQYTWRFTESQPLSGLSTRLCSYP